MEQGKERNKKEKNPLDREAETTLERLRIGETVIGDKEIEVVGKGSGEDTWEGKENEAGVGLENPGQNILQAKGEESEMYVDLKEDEMGEEEEGEMLEERMLEQTQSRIKKPNIKRSGKREPKTNKVKLEIATNVVGKMKLRLGKDVILP